MEDAQYLGFETILHLRMPLRFTPLLRLKRCHARDQHRYSRKSTFLPVNTEYHVAPLKAIAGQATTVDPFGGMMGGPLGGRGADDARCSFGFSGQEFTFEEKHD
jgi:hypothetical protein